MDSPRKFVNPLLFNAMPSAPFKRTAAVLALASLLSACSVLQEDKIDYQSAAKAPTLEVPPDLTQLRRDSRYAIESTSATASGFQNAGSRVVDAGTASNELGPVKMVRQGNQRWLVASLPADTVWEPLREFWSTNGFVLVTDAPDLGIMETEWAENRAKLPQDFIRKTLGRVLDSLYSTGERDKFRTRVERTAQGVEIYITHRGMIENYADAQKDRTIWQPRPSDPELEIEFLRRLMVKLGTSPEAAQTATASTPASETVQLSQDNGQAVIVISDNLDSAWRRTGLALDRSGFTVEDRDRAAGVYFVRYVATATPQDSGFFGRLLGRNKTDQPEAKQYRISLTSQASGQSILRVLNADGQPTTQASSETILKLIAPKLR
jgi:outer membrane protein assembly factor BamC